MTKKYEDDLELDYDGEEIEEAHDEKNAEEQSVASVTAANDKVERAKKRKGDKENSMPSELKVAKEDFEDDLDALISEEATLSEGFKKKAATIFEAVINSKLKEEIDRLEESYEEKLTEGLEVYKDALVEEVDAYLNLVVETWMKENEIAIEQGLRTEIAENFMEGLKDLFMESYIEVPESQVNVVDELADEIDSLTETVNTYTEAMLAMNEDLEAYHKRDIILEKSSGLAETEVEKLFSLVEDLDFEDAETFSEKVDTIKKSYFKKSISEGADETDDLLVDKDMGAIAQIDNDTMAKYVDAIRRQRKE